jgi:hypothetical protein
MTDMEFYEALTPLEPKMELYKRTKQGALTSSEVSIIKQTYPKLYELAGGHIKRHFTASCTSCVITTFQILISVYDRMKEQFKPVELPTVSLPPIKRRSKK